MAEALIHLLEEHGDLAFPHAPATAEKLLELFRSGRDKQCDAAAALARLARTDPGLAFNLARLLHEDGMALNTGERPPIREVLERFNAFRAVSILAPLDTWEDAFRANPAVRRAYAEMSRGAVSAADSAIRTRDLHERDQDFVLLLVFEGVLGALGLANLAPDKALPVLKAGSGSGSVCESIFGFALQDFAAELNKRYALPCLGDHGYPAFVRNLARNALVANAADALAPHRLTGSAA